jgi:diguanylate cyclase (GGDEF)-like protein
MKLVGPEPNFTLSSRRFAASSVSMAGLSLAALSATFAVSISGMAVETRFVSFAGIVAGFVGVFAFLYYTGKKGLQETGGSSLEEKLQLLEEAGQIFAGSLSTSDAFRLAASRMAAIIPFGSAAFRGVDRLAGELTDRGVFRATNETGGEIPSDTRLAIKALTSQRTARGVAAGHNTSLPSIAFPLFREGAVFAVVQLYFKKGTDLTPIDEDLIEAVTSRISTFMLGAMAFDVTRANAMIDAATDLPNERAFYLVLENQVFEAARRRGERPLTILSVDIKEFDDLNARLGCRVGDAVLDHAARTIKDHLRQMDFFARCTGDEFLAILPTASDQISLDVIDRLRSAFVDRPLKSAGSDPVEIELNFGWASFGVDGETAAELVRVARARRDHAKHSASAKVLRFNKEFVN